MNYANLTPDHPAALCLECGMPPCTYHPHREPYTHHRSGCIFGVVAMRRAWRRPVAPEPAPRPAMPYAPVSIHPPKPRPREARKKALRVVRAHALAWAFGAPRLDTHHFNLKYFPGLGTYQCRALYAATRAELGVRWPA